MSNNNTLYNSNDFLTGVWIDWSRNPVFGATLTLTQRNGALLLAFLSLYVAVAGGFFWRLVTFLVHQLRMKNAKGRQDGLFHAQMAILRNTATPFAAAWENSRAWFSWRKSANDALRRSSLLILLAAAVAVATGVSSLLSSRVVRSSMPMGLVTGSSCGTWMFPDNSINWSRKVLKESVQSADYAGSCYYAVTDPRRCASTFVKPTINWTSTSNAPCPFNDELCQEKDGAFEMDTGLLDSREDLGLNTPDKSRLFYRRVTTCAPIHTAPYARETVVLVEDIWNDTYMLVDYGVLSELDYTYRYNEHSSVSRVGYELSSVPYFAGVSTNVWTPKEIFLRHQADISLFFLAQNTMVYNEACDDLWFSAHEQGGDNLTGTFYKSDYWFTALGCTDQHQICRSATDPGSCSELNGHVTMANATLKLGLNEQQMAVYERLNSALLYATMYNAVNGRGSAALRAAQLVWFGQGSAIQPYLPPNQWTVEVAGWFAAQMANLQRSMLEYATGPTDLGDDGYVVGPSTLPSQKLCRSQMAPLASTYQNFSLLGIVLILVGGGLLIVLGLTIDVVVGAIQRRWFHDSPGWLGWVLDEKLQLQRMAYEGAGWGVWQGQTNAIPVTQANTPLGMYQERVTDKVEHATIEKNDGSEAERDISATE